MVRVRRSEDQTILPQSEVPVFIDFLKCMLTLDPDGRKSAAQLLEHYWLKEEVA